MTSARKIKLSVPMPKPRNPLVPAMLQRKAGSHQKPASALRRADKMALRKLQRRNDED